MNTDRALIICDEEENRQKVIAAVLKCGLSPICCSSLEEARTLLFQGSFKVVLCGDILSDGDFRSALKEVKKSTAHTPLIVLSHISEWQAYLNALGAGAFDYIVCPPEAAETERILWCALSGTMYPSKAVHATA